MAFSVDESDRRSQEDFWLAANGGGNGRLREMAPRLKESTAVEVGGTCCVVHHPLRACSPHALEQTILWAKQFGETKHLLLRNFRVAIVSWLFVSYIIMANNRDRVNWVLTLTIARQIPTLDILVNTTFRLDHSIHLTNYLHWYDQNGVDGLEVVCLLLELTGLHTLAFACRC